MNEKRVGVLLCAVLCVGGCGGAVADNPYIVCNAVGITDQEVDVLLRALQQNRDDGYSGSAALAELSDGCAANPFLSYVDCMDCTSAVVDSVY